MDIDETDRRIAAIVQEDGRTPSAEIARAVGLSVSAANERLRRLQSGGVIRAFRAVLDPVRVDAACCCFVLIDMAYAGEAEAVSALSARPEVQELHHISGAHSYLMKVRLADTAAMQHFLQTVIKPLPAVLRTETLFSLCAEKETCALPLGMEA